MKISIRQVLASATGAVVAATIASFFGVSGTIVGVFIGSMAATVGTALAAQSIDRTHHAVRQVVVKAPSSSLLRRLGGTDAAGGVAGTAGEAPAPVTEEATSSEAHGSAAADTAITWSGPATAFIPGAATSTLTPGTRSLNWRVVAVTGVIVFVIVLTVITIFELIAGRPLSDLFGGHGGGTTVGNLVGGPPRTTVPTSTTTTVPPTSTSTSTAGTTTTTSGSTTTTTTTSTVPTSTSLPTATSSTTSTTAPGSG